MERTLIIVKPEGVQRGLIGNVITRLEQRGLKFVGLKLLQITPALAERHYGVHKGKAFYTGLVKQYYLWTSCCRGSRGSKRYQCCANHYGSHERR